MKKISKELKDKGKVSFDGPKVKGRKKSAPATQVHKSKKTYDRKETFEENMDIANFVEAIFEKKYAQASKYLNSAVESKLQEMIQQELNTPLF